MPHLFLRWKAVEKGGLAGITDQMERLCSVCVGVWLIRRNTD